MRPFHLAFPVDNLEKTREFYTNVLGCKVGRSSGKWVDFDMYGHQVVAHLVDELQIVQTNSVDGDKVPSSHFGVILEMKEWHTLSTRLKNSEISLLNETIIKNNKDIALLGIAKTICLACIVALAVSCSKTYADSPFSAILTLMV